MNLSPILVNNSTIYVHSDLIVDNLVIVMFISRLAKYVKFMILPVAQATLSNLFGMLNTI